MEDEKLDVIDRISQVPEPILQHILSFLVVKDALRTSVLSKNWNNACATLQFLNFGDQSFFPSRPTFDEDHDIFYQKVRELLDVVDSIIMKRQQHNINIQKFCLQLPNHNHQVFDLKPYINKFLSLITKGNIKELVFKVGDYHGMPWYTLPEAVYTAKSLIKLILGGFKLEYSPSGGNKLKLYSLKELYLSRTHVDNQLFQLLMSSCPELEILDIDYLYGLDHVQIFGLLKLKRVRLYNCHRKLNKIEIEAPNLEYLCHHGLGLLYIVNVAACRNLKALILHCLIINDKWVADFFPNLPFLERFSLSGCWGLKTVSVSSNRLKELSLHSCSSLMKVEVNAPNLSSFSYSGDVSLSLSLEALAIESMYFGIQSKFSESEWHNKFVEFLGNFNHSKIMKMSSRKTAEFIIPKELRETLRPPLYDVKHLALLVFYGVNQSMFLDLFDSLLWLAPCLDTLTFICRGSKKIVQFTYETSTAEEDSCCASVPSKFEWQSLKKVKFENFQDVEDQWKLKNYFVENGKMLESIEGLIE